MPYVAASLEPGGVRLRWHHVFVLTGLVLIGSLFRFHRIVDQGIWLDEYWAVYLATGRGDAIFDMPQREIIQSPPPATFIDAPHIWHIWTGLDSVIHPPLYYLVLRGWIDLFGDSDLSVRTMSVLFSLAIIVVLFDVIRRLRGPWMGLIVAAFATFAPAQIEYSQQARPYTMLLFLGLLVIEAVFFVKRSGSRPLGLWALGIAVVAFALTHYFAAGAIAAIAIYVAITFQGRTRRAVVFTLAAALLFVAIIWGPIFLMTHNKVMALHNFAVLPNRSIVRSILDIPDRLAFGPIGPMIGPTFLLSSIFGTVGNIEWLVYLPLALLVYVSPLFRRRSQPELLLWWLWAIGSIAAVAMLDIRRHSVLVSVDKYVFLAAPAVYAILAAPFPTRIGRLVPVALLLVTIAYGVQQWRTIPQPLERTRAAAELVSQHIQVGEPVIFAGNYDTQPAFEYFYIAHYRGEWKNPIVLITGAQPDDWKHLSQSLSRYPYFWIFAATQVNVANLPPEWHVKGRFSSEGNNLLQIVQ
jgi:hypothetical protein